jgi:hypothetical protein
MKKRTNTVLLGGIIALVIVGIVLMIALRALT